MMDKLRKCTFCDKDIFIQVEQYLAPASAPLTHEQALHDELVNITGKAYKLLPKRYCPVCGAKMNGGTDDDHRHDH